MTTVHDDIRVLLDGPPAPSLESLEDVLTTGYAHALGIEGQRLRIERSLREIVRDPGPPSRDRNRRIAGLMSEGIVIDLEMIGIEHQQCDRGLLTRGAASS